MYDGVCADPEVFGTLLKLGGAPTFKTKKMPKDEFEDLIGDLDVSIRYVSSAFVVQDDFPSLCLGMASLGLRLM
jgi:hypothetical protein